MLTQNVSLPVLLFLVRSYSIVIVAFALINCNNIFVHAVYKAVCLVDTAAPQTAFVLFQWFGLARADKRRSLYIFQERIYFFQRFLSCVCQYRYSLHASSAKVILLTGERLQFVHCSDDNMAGLNLRLCFFDLAQIGF